MQRANDVREKKIDWQRHLFGITAVLLGLLATLAGFGVGFSDVSGVWVMGTFGKVSMVFAMLWLAWPQLQVLRTIPGGGIAIASVLIGIIVLIVRPRLLLYLIPFLLGVSFLFVTFTWLQRNFFPPK